MNQEAPHRVVLEIPFFAVNRYNSYRSDSTKATIKIQETWLVYRLGEDLVWRWSPVAGPEPGRNGTTTEAGRDLCLWHAKGGA